MYYNGQIVYDLDAKKSVQVGGSVDGNWAWNNMPKRTTHFLCSGPKGKMMPSEPMLYMPKSIEDADKLLSMGLIQPAPIPSTHCWRCMGWLCNHKDGKACT